MLPLLALAAAPSIVKGISGLLGIGAGNRRARRNIRPVQQVNPLIAQNNAIAENDALVGMPQEQYNLANQNIQRNQSAGYRALGRSANPTGLASLVRAGNDASLNLSAQDAGMRMNNRRFAFGTRGALANEQKDVFNWNSKAKYMEEAQAAAEQIGAGKANAFGALTDLSQLGQAAMSAENGGGQETSQVPSGYSRYQNWSRRGY